MMKYTASRAAVTLDMILHQTGEVMSTALPGSAAAGRLRFHSFMVGLIQTGLFPWRVLDGGALEVGGLQGGRELQGLGGGAVQRRWGQRTGRVHVCGGSGGRARVSFTLNT